MTNVTAKKASDSSYVTWTPDLAIGHQMIDDDHRSIFDLANRLQAEIDATEEPEYSIVGEVLVELIEHTGSHFMREEALMQAIGYPAYAKHKAEHDVLMTKVNSLLRRFMDGEKNVSLDVSAFMRQWLVRHIMTFDRELGKKMHSVK